MRISLIIATYNWKEALALTLGSAARQTLLPDEVIVADDGSREDTAALVARAAQSFPAPLTHVWQEDRGFRLARIRNLALARARGDYVIQIDGDVVLHPRFVADQARAARPGHFVRGPRVFLPPGLTAEFLAGRERLPFFWAPGLGKRWGGLRVPVLTRLLLDHRAQDARGHCLAFWREDALRVNGFDERFEGWGREDDEFAQRLLNAGVRKRRLRFGGVVYHLHHQAAPRPELGRNDALLDETKRTRRTWCEAGLSQHLGMDG
jgi:glycosyltransferase involved in cell wall biosynthesis